MTLLSEDGGLMYASPRIRDFGAVEIHTYQIPSSTPGTDEPTTSAAGGGGDAGVGLIGLMGAAVLAGRDNSGETTAGVTDEEEEKQAQK
jgi:hypothetical protein